MKIGKRNITSFSNFMEQFQNFAIEHPVLALTDVVIVCSIVLVIDWVL